MDSYRFAADTPPAGPGLCVRGLLIPTLTDSPSAPTLIKPCPIEVHHVRTTTMADAPGQLQLAISTPLFKLATNCIRLQSNALSRLLSLDQVVSEQLLACKDLSDDDTALVGDLLVALPAAGDIAITLSLDGEAERAFGVFAATMAARCARPLSNAELLSVLLFLHSVESTARDALQALHALQALTDSGSIAASAPAAADDGSNVVPLKR